MKTAAIMLFIYITLTLFGARSWSTPSMIESAQKLFEAKEYNQTVTLLSANAEKLTEKGFLILAACYSELKQFDNELRILNQLATKDVKNYQWQMLLAQAHQKKSIAATNLDEKKKQETLAISAYRQTLKLNKKFQPAFDELLQVFLEKKENHEARELLMDGLKTFGERGLWLNALCELQASDGFLDPALETCERAIKKSPHYPDNYIYFSQALFDQNQEQKAQKVMRFAGKKFPKSEFTQWAAGKVYLLSKNYEAARNYFERAVKIDPKSKRSLEGYAESLYQSGNPEMAYPQYQSACQKGAKNSEELHVKAAELRMKSKDSLGSKYRGLAESCL